MAFIESLRQRTSAAVDAFFGASDPQEAAGQVDLDLPGAISTAQVVIDRARNYIDTVPAPVGQVVRQRIAEAEGSLRSAAVVQSRDPVDALAFARMAAALASQACQTAQAAANSGVRSCGTGS